MNNPVCAVCGHGNRFGAAACEVCDASLDAYGGGVPRAVTPSPRFRNAGDVISPTLAVYRKHFVLVGLLVLATTVPAALFQHGVVRAAGGDVGSFRLVLWLVSLAGSAALSGALVFAVSHLRRAGAASALECLRGGLKTLPNVFAVMLIYKVVTVFGFFLFVVPGVIFCLMYAVAVPVAVAEGRGPLDALKRSAALTGGFKGLMFLTYFVWYVLIFLLTLLLTRSFGENMELEQLPSLLLLSGVAGMLNSSVDVLTAYIYFGLLNERAQGPAPHAFSNGPAAATR